jgi:transglutaminase-like putative cysteine protease
MKLYIEHRTSYQYELPASYSIETLRLTPRNDPMQRLLEWRLTAPGRQVRQLDAFDNVTHLLTLEGEHDGISIVVNGVVETDDSFQGILPHQGALSPLVYLAATPLTQFDDALVLEARTIFPDNTAAFTHVVNLLEAVRKRVAYLPGSSLVSDSALEVLARGAGVCQDQAHAAIALCRAAGVPARYVSGYIQTNNADHAASHAWIDVWSRAEDAWISCDVTHGMVTASNLCRLAVGRDYLDAAPVRGMRRGGGKETLAVLVNVSPNLQQ